MKTRTTGCEPTCAQWQGGCKSPPDTCGDYVAWRIRAMSLEVDVAQYKRLVEELSDEVEKLSWMLDEYLRYGHNYRDHRAGYFRFNEVIKLDLAQAWVDQNGPDEEGCPVCLGSGCGDCMNEDGGEDR